MATKRSDPLPLDIRYDVRLQARFIAEGKISPDEVEKRALAAPDAADNVATTPAPEPASASARGSARPSRIKAVSGE